MSDENYSLSDSEDDYSANEKQLLNNIRNREIEPSDSENEVFGVASNESDSSDDKSELALSDVEGQDTENNLPDARAWGKDKRKYYKTDYVDADYGGFQGKDAHLAELEEEEARNLQKQLAQHLDDDDFSLDVSYKKLKVDEKQTEDYIKNDLSKLSKREKLQILQKESPEFFSLVEDFQTRMLVVKNSLQPILQQYKKGQIPNCSAIDFIQTQYELILNYFTNIYMYLLVKSSKLNTQNHPVIKRLYQYRQLLLQLDPVYEEIMKPQIELLLQKVEQSTDESLVVKKKRKTLKLLSLATESVKPTPKQKYTEVIDEKLHKRIKLDKNNTIKNQSQQPGDNMDIDAKSVSSNDDMAETFEEKDQETITDGTKRAITYKMAKNKGLTPHRKKEQRNPRVKHRLKFRKAVIRRKGAVREPRKELSRYSGEMSGIKASVSRSIKIKS